MAGAARADDSPRPNLVFILTDNQAPWTLGCYGNPEIQTPNLDALAGRGVRFDRAYAARSHSAY